MFAKLIGAKVSHVPFKGAGDVRVAMAGKQILVAAVSVGESLHWIKGGAPLRILGQFSPERTSLATDLPTAREQGFNLEMSSLRGLAAPKGLPAYVRERLVKAVERAVADPEFQTKSVPYYAPLRYLSPAQFEAALRESEVRFRQLWKDTPWTDK
jgi:tripartite-type tricarboxylate transporter receptor subunit TctC